MSAPELVAKLGLRSPHDLRDAPLLRDDDPSAWGQWLDARRVRGIDWRRGAELSDSAMVVDAAVRGQGVALARISLAQDALESGRLVRPFPRVRPMPTGRRYTLVWRRSRAAAPEVRAFRAWLLDEIGTLRALVGAS